MEEGTVVRGARVVPEVQLRGAMVLGVPVAIAVAQPLVAMVLGVGQALVVVRLPVAMVLGAVQVIVAVQLPVAMVLGVVRAIVAVRLLVVMVLGAVRVIAAVQLPVAMAPGAGLLPRARLLLVATITTTAEITPLTILPPSSIATERVATIAGVGLLLEPLPPEPPLELQRLVLPSPMPMRRVWLRGVPTPSMLSMRLYRRVVFILLWVQLISINVVALGLARLTALMGFIIVWWRLPIKLRLSYATVMSNVMESQMTGEWVGE